ncbi:Stp1/IreP family PP2C-type Ser/Thr phosphatase [Pueribacillus theae]|uniref:protein-serine/threonine phosphatase n=1 Tax=Pueribacillus theae TaxID=2171751 RepID=A0A2U1K7E8_9BACI|nr:Stp1/IreP family PP2C-type Ser/Thr phosphatase [Pueribacillus theae]PWA13461.1 Stp1/IreP family PP2C-type Ser/Thr phosphatase [Pueribacillus theae]
MESIFRTDTGKIRTLNEDSGGLFYNNDNLLAIVADGMGGHQAGEIASSMAVSYLKEQWQKAEIELNPAKTEEWLVENVQNTNKKLLEFAKTNPDCRGMGTTVVSVICTPNYVTLAHIGDSRVYLLNENGFSLLTEDHSLVNELVKNGQISKEEAEHHPRKHVLLRALGTEEQVEIDIRSISWEPNDVILLCSDGLTNKVDEKEIQKIISSDSSIPSKAEELISLANQAGGDDNITLILIKHGFSNKKKVNEYD